MSRSLMSNDEFLGVFKKVVEQHYEDGGHGVRYTTVNVTDIWEMTRTLGKQEFKWLCRKVMGEDSSGGKYLVKLSVWEKILRRLEPEFEKQRQSNARTVSGEKFEEDPDRITLTGNQISKEMNKIIKNLEGEPQQ